MNPVVSNYLWTGVYVLIDFACAWVVAFLLVRFRLFVSDTARLGVFLLGTGILLIAGIGRLGWSIQTIGGATENETLDQLIFFYSSLFGTFVLLLGYFVDRAVKRGAT